MNYLLTGEETARLRFRTLAPSDFDTWLELFKVPTARLFLGLEDFETPEACCEEWFRLSEERLQSKRGGMNVVVDKQTGAFIGQCGLLLQEVEGRAELEVGYSILPSYWNKGYATECATHCRDVAFAKEYAQSLVSIIHIDNQASAKVALKNGMHRVKQTAFEGHPIHLFRIHRADWLLRQAAPTAGS